MNLIDRQVVMLERMIASLEADLRYADGGAYSQDKYRILELNRELSQWKKYQKDLARLAEIDKQDKYGELK